MDIDMPEMDGLETLQHIRKKYKTALETRLLHLPWTLTLDEKYFLENGVRTKDENE